ncbi:CPBP family intramembrane metalloprotease [Rubripirellula sp.]|jgi:membrane protease YdiL (CAAX protease family)|nr:CPBP family intramembrane metalloprotease [Rubripirellula sp.]
MSEPDSEQQQQTPDEVFATAVLFETILAVVAIALGWLLGPSAREFMPEWNPEDLQPIFTGIWQGGLAAIPMLLAVELIRRIPWDPIRELEQLSDDQMIGALVRLRVPELLIISLCAGVGEELLFRGWLMGWLRDGLSSLNLPIDPVWVALAVSSIVFGFFHPITKMYIFLAALMGSYFGLLLVWSDNLLIPIMAHAVYDAIQLLMTKRQVERKAISTVSAGNADG